MMLALSFEQAPPISAPFRFFLTAPLFGCVAGLVIAFFGGALLESRWTGVALGVTHLLTLGFMLHAMCGALLQLVPVAVGANVWRPVLLATVTHAGLVAGTALLVCGFLVDCPLCFRAATFVLGASLALFVGAVGVAVARTPARSDTLTAMRLSMAALALTAGFGIASATAFGWQAGVPLGILVDLHVGWGMLGWSLLLLVGVAFLVVPMFQLTPPYHSRFTGLFPAGLIAALVVWSLTVVAGYEMPVLRAGAALVLGLLAAMFAIETLRIQRLRRRRHVDAAFMFWRTGILSLLVAVVLGILRLGLGEGALAMRLEFALGLVLIPGFFVSVIVAMSYKILPFLTWFHLQGVVAVPPSMDRVIPETAMRGQLWMHWAAVSVLLAGTAFPGLMTTGGLLLAASFAWLELNILRGFRCYAQQRAAAIAGG